MSGNLLKAPVSFIGKNTLRHYWETIVFACPKTIEEYTWYFRRNHRNQNKVRNVKNRFQLPKQITTSKLKYIRIGVVRSNL